jgi:hypothetical protein
MAGDISKNKNNNVTKQNKHKPHPLDGCTAIPRKILPPVARLFLVKIITRTIIYYSPILSISLNNNLDVLCVCVRVHNKLYERTIQGRGGTHPDDKWRGANALFGCFNFVNMYLRYSTPTAERRIDNRTK